MEKHVGQLLYISIMAEKGYNYQFFLK